jgi:hypothetical protein
MSKITAAYRIRKEDLGPKVPEYVSKIVDAYNKLYEDFYNALKKGITIEDNLQMFIRDLKVKTTSLPIVFKNTLGKPIKGVVILSTKIEGLDTVITNAVTLDWSIAEGSNVQINNVTGLTAGVEYTIKLLCIAE